MLFLQLWCNNSQSQKMKVSFIKSTQLYPHPFHQKTCTFLAQKPSTRQRTEGVHHPNTTMSVQNHLSLPFHRHCNCAHWEVKGTCAKNIASCWVLSYYNVFKNILIFSQKDGTQTGFRFLFLVKFLRRPQAKCGKCTVKSWSVQWSRKDYSIYSTMQMFACALPSCPIVDNPHRFS